MRRVVVVAALAAALSVQAAPAMADDTVVVPGLAFPAADTYLTYFGCSDLYHADTRSPQVRIGRDGTVPAGRRSFGLRMPGAGTAAGPVRVVQSVAHTTVAGLAARADQGGAGVAYVWYAAPDLNPGEVWSGRVSLQAGAAWQYVDTAAATYTWTRYDAATGTVLEDAGAASIADFTTTHGDGPGYLLAGFGCDGEAFSVDALRFGSPGTVTTYDLEGIAVSTTMAASRGTLPAAGEVTLTGSTLDAGVVPIGSALVLQARPAGQRIFRPTGPALHSGPDGTVTAVVAPSVTTDYRWYLPDTGLADAGYSPTVRVGVLQRTR